MNRQRTAVVRGCALFIGLLAALWCGVPASADAVKFQAAGGPELREGRYVVTLAADSDPEITPGALVRAYGGRIEPYAAMGFTGFLYVAAPARARAMSADPRVQFVEQIPAAAETLPSRAPEPAAASRPGMQPRGEWSETAVLWSSGEYRYDGVGNIKSIGDDTYRYDGVGRLTYATANTDRSNVQEYTYDDYGNLKEIATTTASSVEVRQFAVDETTNRLTQEPCELPNVTCFTGVYDQAGNQLGSGSSDTFVWDQLGMMTEMHHIGTLRYIYDANDERIATVDLIGQVERSRFYTLRDADNKVSRELHRAGGAWKRGNDYVYRDGVLLAAFTSENSGSRPDRHYHADHLGSTRIVTDANGYRASTTTFWPFGVEAPGSQRDRTTHLKFTGHERDTNTEALSVDYMHARYYNPAMGRFLSVDPAMDTEKNLPEPQRWNRYAYVTNNPLKYDDPDGREKRIMVLSVVEPNRMRLNTILNNGTNFGIDSGYDVQVQHSLGGKSLLHALSNVDATGTDIPVILSHGGAPLQAETGGGADGSRSFSFSAAEIGAALDGSKAQAIVLAACGSMQSAQAVANRTNTITFGITARVGASSLQLGRSGAILANIYAKTGNAALAVAMANRLLSTKDCTPGGQCDPRPQWHYVEPEKQK